MEYLKHETSLLRTSVWLLLSVKRDLAHCHQHYKSKYNKKIDLATVGILNLSSDKKNTFYMPAFVQVFRRICFGKSHATSTSTQFPCQRSLKMADKTTTCTRIMGFPALILSLCTLRKMHFTS